MSRLARACRDARRSLVARERLDAAGRAELDLHLRRCRECRALAEDLDRVEAGAGEIPQLSDDASRAIYDRLVPLVHEVSSGYSDAPRSSRARPVLGWATAAAFAAAAAAVIALRLGGEDAIVAPAAEPEVAPASSAPVVSEGRVVRAEGKVLVDGSDLADRGVFSIADGTAAEVEEGGRLSFRVDDVALVSLVGEARWSVSSASDQLLEMELPSGRLAVEFRGSSGRMLDVRTPDALVRVRGTLFTVEVIPGEATRVGVVEGWVEVVPVGSGSSTVVVSEDRLVSIPGGAVTAIDDAHRFLAAEVETLDFFEAVPGRMVGFDGSPERVRVEVDGRLLGVTPLSVRLPDGPVSYRLTAPGMAPMEGSIAEGSGSHLVGFSLVQEGDYEPAVSRPAGGRSVARAAGSATDGADGGEEPWDLSARARAAMMAGDVPYARGLLERAASEAAGDDLIHGLSLLAECCAAMGDWAAAVAAYERVESLAPGTDVAQNSRYEIGRLAMDRLGDFSRARAAFTAYVASPLGGALEEEAYYSLCEIDGREGKHRSALHCFDEFLRVHAGGRHEPEARLWRGALYQDVERRWTDAERDLGAFVSAKPRHPRVEEARYRIALGRYQVGDKRGAMGMLDEYLREHPDGRYHLRAVRLRRAILDPDFSWEPESE